MRTSARFLFILALFYSSIHTFDFYSYYLFAKRSLCDMAQIGAIMPTSRFAARELIRPLQFKDGKRAILEIGGGSGAISQVIAEQLGPDDRFDIVEVDEAFCNQLRAKFKRTLQVQVHQSPIEQWHPSCCYDVIISTIPLTNLPLDVLQGFLARVQEIAAPGATFSYLEYMTVPLKKIFLSAEQAAGLQEKRICLKEFREQFRSHTKRVFANVPPTYAHHILLPGITEDKK